MKIVVVIGSYRRNGNTDQLTGLIKEHLAREAQAHAVALEIETIYLGRQNLEFCRGCRICFDRGEAGCPVKDDMPAIKAQLMAADGVLLASPVYVDDVSGLMKTFIDRLCHACHRPQFTGKVVYLLATTGGTRTAKTLDTLQMAARTWGFHVAGQAGFKMGALMKKEVARVQLDAQATKTARVFFRAISERAFRRPGFYSLMVFKIQQMAWQAKGQPGTLDMQFWQEKGWLDPARTFYFPHEAPGWKVALARLAGRIIHPFVA